MFVHTFDESGVTWVSEDNWRRRRLFPELKELEQRVETAKKIHGMTGIEVSFEVAEDYDG